jgi:hypothetical protein
MNFDISTAEQHRKPVWEHLCNMPYITCEKPDVSSAGRAHYLRQLALSKFCICPQGNGIDTHRLWEALYVGCIPVVIRHIAQRDWCEDLPILFIDSWNELSGLFLEQQWAIYMGRLWNLNKLFISFWIKRIAQKIDRNCQSHRQVCPYWDCYCFGITASDDAGGKFLCVGIQQEKEKGR